MINKKPARLTRGLVTGGLAAALALAGCGKGADTGACNSTGKVKVGLTAKIATLDLAPGITVGVLRHDGFLEGYGIKAGDPSIVCSGDTQGDQAKGQTAMENCLQKAPDINLVYTINEPAALGAYTALKAKGKEKDVTIVSVDGGCTGVKGVENGQIAATSQQYPLKMAQLGVEAVVKFP